MSGGIVAQAGHLNGHLADFARQIPLFVVSGIAFSVSAGLLLAFNLPLSNPLDTLANSGTFLISLMALGIIDCFVACYRVRPENPLAFLKQRYLGDRLLRLVARFPVFMIIIAITPIFGQMKALIPLLHPYDWDATLIAADRAIFGTDAWLAIHPLVGYPLITSGLSYLYHAWILLLYPGTLFLLLHSSCNAIRERYFLAFVLIWSAMGIVLATWMASVGPCFMEPILGDGRFAPLMSYLNNANEHYPVLVLHVQDLLLEWHHRGEHGLARGISAMPSMHVSMAFLYYLAIREVSRKAGWFFLVFFLLIWIASVHLAYHYAVDGAVSVIVTAFLWHVSRQIISRWDIFLRLAGAARSARAQTT